MRWEWWLKSIFLLRKDNYEGGGCGVKSANGEDYEVSTEGLGWGGDGWWEKGFWGDLEYPP